MKRTLCIFCLSNILFMTIELFAASLTITGANSKVFNGGAYDGFTITNSTAITIQNATFTGPCTIKGSKSITIEKCDIDGQRDITNCNGLTVKNCDTVIIRNNKIHDFADDGIVLYHIQDVKCLGNEIYGLMGCGTQSLNRCNGPCYNGHSDGFEPMDFRNLEISGNFCHDFPGTAGMYILPADIDGTPRFAENTNLVMMNNLWYLTKTGGVVWIHNVNGVKLFNNTFWSRNTAGLLLTPAAKNIVARNNIISKINYSLMGANPNSSEYDFNYNLLGSAEGQPANTDDIVAVNPRFAKIPALNATAITQVTAADFALTSGSPAIGKGTVGVGFPQEDYFAQRRSNPYDIGAVEYPHSNSGIHSKGTQLRSSRRAHGRITMVDLHGRILKEFGNQNLDSQHFSVEKARAFSAGVYYVQYNSGSSANTFERILFTK